jgi:hypothetical protein
VKRGPTAKELEKMSDFPAEVEGLTALLAKLAAL